MANENRKKKKRKRSRANRKIIEFIVGQQGSSCVYVCAVRLPKRKSAPHSKRVSVCHPIENNVNGGGEKKTESV